MMRQTIAQKRIVRKIQKWLAIYEYKSGYGDMMLHRCCGDIMSKYTGYALCRTGVVIAYGGGCYVEPWVEFPVKQLKELWKAAMDDREKCDRTLVLTENELLMMQHAVGKRENAKKKHWGRRNRYAVGVGDTKNIKIWDSLVKRKLAICSSDRSNPGSVIMYHLTKSGCRAAGLHKAAIDRALEP